MIGTGDFTHPAWRDELREKLEPAEDGLYTLKDPLRLPCETDGTAARPRFIVTGRSARFTKRTAGSARYTTCSCFPDSSRRNALPRGWRRSGTCIPDGRPILGLDSRDLLEITLETCPGAVFIPAHIWTPHFSLFGAYSGFDDIRECFEDLTPHIHALETGLSSDPPMNWRLSALDGYTLVSNSDAHSPAKLGRRPIFSGRSCPFLPWRGVGDARRPWISGNRRVFPRGRQIPFRRTPLLRAMSQAGADRTAGGRCPVCGGRITVGFSIGWKNWPTGRKAIFRRHGGTMKVWCLCRKSSPLPPDARPRGKRSRRRISICSGSLGRNFLSCVRYRSISSSGRPACVAGDPPPAGGEGGAPSRLRRGIRAGPPLLDPEEIERYAGQLFSLRASAAGRAGNRKKAWEGRAEKAGTPAAVAWRTPPLWTQRRAMDRRLGKEGAVAVIAGPGTGKTRTLVCRIAYLVEERGVDPAHITAVTFTNKAAREMKERLLAHFGDKRTVKAMTIGTFHAICLNRLSEREGTSGGSGSGGGRGHRVGDPGRIGAEALGAGGPPGGLGPKKRFGWVENEGKAGPYSLFYDAYTQRLQDLSVLDFDDLLLRELQAQEGGTAPSGFTHLLVDEFQDINPVQFRLIRAWSRGGRASSSSGIRIRRFMDSVVPTPAVSTGCGRNGRRLGRSPFSGTIGPPRRLSARRFRSCPAFRARPLPVWRHSAARGNGCGC